MKAWKKFQYWVAEYLGWEYIAKKHYGDSCPDVKGDGFIGECKHHKSFAIHTLKIKTDNLYKDDIILFTKVKGTHYDPRNVLVTIRLDWFKIFLEDYKKVLKVDIDDTKVKFTDDNLTNNLKTLTYKLEQVKLLTNDMKKILKELEVK